MFCLYDTFYTGQCEIVTDQKRFVEEQEFLDNDEYALIGTYETLDKAKEELKYYEEDIQEEIDRITSNIYDDNYE